MKSTEPRAAKRPVTSGLVALAMAVAVAAALAGCGGEEWEPSGAGPTIDHDMKALTDPMSPLAGAALGGDMVGMPAGARGVETVKSALSSGTAGDPKVLYLFYANGKDLPQTDVNACAGTPPRFICQFASTLNECQRQIQMYLDKWYGDFNIVFTLTRPTSGKYYTEVVSSGGGNWCGVATTVAGVSPFLCQDIQGGVSYAFLGGTSAKQTAVIVAQEAAHLMGLEHVTSDKDIMYPQICSDCDGFLNQDLAIDGDRCDRTSQNSYQMLMNALGPWPGGPKPSAFGCMNDTVPPVVKILSPINGTTVEKNFSVSVDATDDCELASVEVSVMPQALKADSYAPPFEWDLTNMSGQQTITVTAVDGSGHVTKQSVTVTAPKAATLDATTANAAGCTVGSSAFGLAGALPALGVLVVFSRRRRPARRRAVTGALKADS